jgi:hypothetical protein
MTRKIRPIRVEGNIAYVQLSRGREAVIDAASVAMVHGFNWFFDGFYAARTVQKDEKRRSLRMHCVLLLTDDGMEVDHANGDRLDNRLANLRPCSSSQNKCNSVMRSDNTSGYKGVTWSKKSKKWRARIYLSGREKNLGWFSTAHDAYEAYNNAAMSAYGEFAKPQRQGRMGRAARAGLHDA